MSIAFIDEFDIPFENKWGFKSTALCMLYAGSPDSLESGYKSMHRLCELLWKLKVWKP